MKGCPQGRELQAETGSHVLYILRRSVHYSDNAHEGRQQCESQKYMRRLSLLWPGGIYRKNTAHFLLGQHQGLHHIHHRRKLRQGVVPQACLSLQDASLATGCIITL